MFFTATFFEKYLLRSKKVELLEKVYFEQQRVGTDFGIPFDTSFNSARCACLERILFTTHKSRCKWLVVLHGTTWYDKMVPHTVKGIYKFKKKDFLPFFKISGSEISK